MYTEAFQKRVHGPLSLFAKWVFDQHNRIGHVRKYTGVPYTEHLAEVALIIRDLSYDSFHVAAALAHDVIEDVPGITQLDVVKAAMAAGFTSTEASRIGWIVQELTDVYTKENFPHLNRAQRKTMEVARLAQVSSMAQTIKLADIISNGKDILKNDPAFANVYMVEIDVLAANFGNHPDRQLEEIVDGYFRGFKSWIGSSDLDYPLEIM